MQSLVSCPLVISLVLFQSSIICLAADVNSEVSLSKADAKCIADNVDLFLSKQEDPVPIYLDICVSSNEIGENLSADEKPAVRVNREETAGRVRQSYVVGGNLPDVSRPMPYQQSDKAHPQVKPIYLSKAELLCLKAASTEPGFPATDPFTISASCH